MSRGERVAREESEDASSFPRMRNLLPSEHKAGKISGTVNRTTNASQKDNQRISTMLLLLWHFSPGDKIENCPAQFLAVCWFVRVEFKVHRVRDGFSVSNALLLGQSLQRSSAITSIRLERERFSKEPICSSLFRCSSRTVRLSFALFLFFLDFAIGIVSFAADTGL